VSQEEIKERFKDVQDDAQMARDEVNQLLQQRDEWMDLKLTLEQTIGDYALRSEEQAGVLLQKEHDLLARTDEIRALEQSLSESQQIEVDRQKSIEALQEEIKQIKETEAAMNETLRKTRVALTKEKARVQMYENLAATVPLSSQPAPRPEPVVMAAPEVRLDSPYVLQQDLIRTVNPEDREIIDLDDRDPLPAVMRTLVPSVVRLAEIQAVHDSNKDNLER